MQNLIITLLIPMLCAISCTLVQQRLATIIISSLASFLMLANSIYIGIQIFAYHQQFVYHIGNWSQTIGIELSMNCFNIIVLNLVNILTAVHIIHIHSSLKWDLVKEEIVLYCPVFFFLITGLSGILISNDIFNIYVFLEIASITSYTLMALGKNKFATIATFEYLVIGTIGTTFYLIGVGFLYFATGSLNITDMANQIAIYQSENQIIIQTGLIFLSLGLIMKIAIAPMHNWLVKAYSWGSEIILSFVSSVSTKISMYILIVVFYSIIKRSNFDKAGIFFNSLKYLSLFSILIGSSFAMIQNDIKKVFAYSGVSHLSYIALGIAMQSNVSLMAAIIHYINHGVTKSLLFISLGKVKQKCGSTQMNQLSDVYKVDRLSCVMIVIGLSSLIGIPMTAGFSTKFYLIKGALIARDWFSIIIIILGSCMSLIYSLRIIESMYFAKSSKNKTVIIHNSNRINQNTFLVDVATSFLVGIVILLGIYATPLIKIGTMAADCLMKN